MKEPYFKIFEMNYEKLSQIWTLIVLIHFIYVELVGEIEVKKLSPQSRENWAQIDVFEIIFRFIYRKY